MCYRYAFKGFHRNILLASAPISTAGLIIKSNNSHYKGYLSSSSCTSQCEEAPQKHPHVALSKPGPKIVFLGSGSSTGCPKPICSLIFPSVATAFQEQPSMATPTTTNTFLSKVQLEMKDKCKVSKLASIGNPVYNKNYRNNPSILISHCNDDNDDDHHYQNVIIDVGKTFRESALRWMPLHSIYSVDAIVLTHEHADAILGLDDLRGFQIRPYMLKSRQSDDAKNSMSTSFSLPVFLSSNCFDKVKQQFDYLVPKELLNSELKSKCCCGNVTSKDLIDKKPVVERAVASLQFHIVQHFKPFIAAGLVMTPLPVMHGEDLICNGYAFSLRRKNNDIEKESRSGKSFTHGSIANNGSTNVVYLSDISRMIPETEDFILNQLPPTDILIIDSLMLEGTHPVHFSLAQALEVIKRLKPKQTYIVGMNCDAFPEHDESNKMLEKLHPSVYLAHDGLVIEA